MAALSAYAIVRDRLHNNLSRFEEHRKLKPTSIEDLSKNVRAVVKFLSPSDGDSLKAAFKTLKSKAKVPGENLEGEIKNIQSLLGNFKSVENVEQGPSAGAGAGPGPASAVGRMVPAKPLAPLSLPRVFHTRKTVFKSCASVYTTLFGIYEYRAFVSFLFC